MWGNSCRFAASKRDCKRATCLRLGYTELDTHVKGVDHRCLEVMDVPVDEAQMSIRVDRLRTGEVGFHRLVYYRHDVCVAAHQRQA